IYALLVNCDGIMDEILQFNSEKGKLDSGKLWPALTNLSWMNLGEIHKMDNFLSHEVPQKKSQSINKSSSTFVLTSKKKQVEAVAETWSEMNVPAHGFTCKI